MIIIKCNICGKKRIVDGEDFENHYELIDYCCGDKDYNKVETKDYKYNEIIMILEEKLKDKNYNELGKNISYILEPIEKMNNNSESVRILMGIWRNLVGVLKDNKENK